MTSQTEIVPGPTAEELDQAVPWDAADIFMMAEMLEGSSATVGAAQYHLRECFPRLENSSMTDDQGPVLRRSLCTQHSNLKSYVSVSLKI